MFGPTKGKDGQIGKSDEELIHDLITIHNAENWLGGEGDDFSPGFFSSGSVAPTPADVAAPSPSPAAPVKAEQDVVTSPTVTTDTTAPEPVAVSVPTAKEEGKDGTVSNESVSVKTEKEDQVEAVQPSDDVVPSTSTPTDENSGKAVGGN